MSVSLAWMSGLHICISLSGSSQNYLYISSLPMRKFKTFIAKLECPISKII